MSLKEKLAQIQAEAIESMLSAADPDVLNDIRVRFLGKKGLLTEASKGMKDVPAEERPKLVKRRRPVAPARLHLHGAHTWAERRMLVLSHD